MMRSICAVALATAVCVATTAGTAQESTAMPTLAQLQKMTLRFAPAEIGTNVSALPAGERAALGKLVEASRIMDALFLRQVWGGNDAMLQDLARLAAAPAAPRATRSAGARLHYFLINKGPWDRLDHNHAFVPGAPAKPESANFYPADATKADVQKWIDSLSAGRESGRDRILHHDPPQRRALSSSCRTTSSTRVTWRARPSSFATRRSSPAQPR